MTDPIVRLVITGAAGRMGKALVRCSQLLPGLRVTAALDIASHPDIGKDSGILAGIGSNGVPITASLAEGTQADALIDFSHHTATPGHVNAAARAGLAAVIGTTALSDTEIATLKQAAQRIPVLFAPNMSLGMNLLFALVKQAAAILDIDYDAEIIETHHRHKKDAPSGTAIRLAEQIAAGRQRKLDEIACFGRNGLIGARPAGELGIHAVRCGDYIGEHVVRFATDGESVEFVHKATSRDTFALGALRAARWLHGKPAGFYDISDMLKI